MPSPDYANLALAFKGYGQRVTEPNEIETAFLRATKEVEAGRLAILDLVIEEDDPREKLAASKKK